MCEALCVQAQAVTLTVWQAFNVAQDRWREQQNKKSVHSKDKSNKAQVGYVTCATAFVHVLTPSHTLHSASYTPSLQFLMSDFLLLVPVPLHLWAPLHWKNYNNSSHFYITVSRQQG